jgi:hypothetical protein
MGRQWQDQCQLVWQGSEVVDNTQKQIHVSKISTLVFLYYTTLDTAGF